MSQRFCGLRIWDLSLERDAEEEALYQAQLKQKQAEAPQDLPPQLLFVHQVLSSY
jgi:ribosome assembly protein RRB1